MQKHFVYEESLKVMILEQNWPKIAKSLSHSNKHHPVTNWKPVLCCSLLRTGVIWSNLGTKQTTRATAFRTLWKRSYSFGTVEDHRVASYSNCNVRWQRNAPKSLLFLLKGIFWSSWSHKQCILFLLVLTKIHLIVSKTILYLLPKPLKSHTVWGWTYLYRTHTPGGGGGRETQQLLIEKIPVAGKNLKQFLYHESFTSLGWLLKISNPMY